ncbi:MAG TPA: energy transducer TonB [Nitrospiraceae bacterium]|nr:energy transducer TonB [Nitrospiraceae bacterium]
MSPSTWDKRPAQSHGSYVQGWGLSVLLHTLIGVPFLGALVLLTPMPPEALVLPFRWEVSIVSTTPPPIVTAALPSPLAPAPPAAQPPAEVHSQTSDSGLAQAFPLREPSVPLPPDQGTSGEGKNQPHRERHERHIAETDRSSAPFADQGAPEPPPPDVPSRMERSLSVMAKMARPTVRQRPQPVERPVLTRSVLPDYGWLSEALRDKIERTKRYPAVARANRWQGQVLVQFNVRRDGHLVDPRVAESSGYAVLDHAALETVRAASPVTLRHGLEQPTVLVSLPLTYQLE